MQTQPDTRKTPQSLHVESPAFGANGSIPLQYTADGENTAPELTWGAVPEGTKSIAIIVEDPDVPDPNHPISTFTHLIVTGVPPEMRSLDAGEELPPGAAFGSNDHGERGWFGPKPPIGRHRYFFKVFALDTHLAAPGIRRLDFIGAIKGHVLAQGELVGTYERPADRRSAEHGGERRPRSHGRDTNW
jgi:Raf kinase inhibitor-like YbhB/YbcL family protein